MKNFIYRVPLGNRKYAYAQHDKYAESAREHMSRIRRYWAVPTHYYHFQPGGHIAAIYTHVNSEWFGRVDLSRFFSHVTRNRIIRRLKVIGYDYEDAVDFAVASTVYDGHGKKYVLPYGFCQSSLLATLDLDQSALGACIRRLRRSGGLVSVYVDDIIVSADDAGTVETHLNEIESEARRSQLPINLEKRAGPTKNLRAFNIEVSRSSMAIAANRLAEMEQKVLQHGRSHTTAGIVSYVRGVNIAQAADLERLIV